ncbi:MAG TPA: YciI family protein [Actinomycetota bacterium]|nr:YciI family protein [Actinomycetota bacterium]
MKYALLIYGEASSPDMTPEAMEASMDDWWKYEAWLGEKGIRLAGEALQEPHHATTVRVQDGKTVTTDGPFAETKEQLGGFYLIEAANLDEALAAAARCPGAALGSVEVRPVQEFEAP